MSLRRNTAKHITLAALTALVTLSAAACATKPAPAPEPTPIIRKG